MKTPALIQNRYRLDEQIGEGAFSLIFRATDTETNEPLAIKVLHSWANADEELRRRLKREAKLVQLLKSPHTVRLFEFCETEQGDLCIVMEYLKGRDLGTVLRRAGLLAPQRVQRIALEILDALGEAHSLGILHRDLKPCNIFLCLNGKGEEAVKLLDFGIAKVMSSSSDYVLRESTKLTTDGGVIGTPIYMSPEQCAGDELTASSDLYAVGILIYEMLTGRPPFHDANPVKVMQMHHMNPVPPLPDALENTPLARAMHRALEKDRKHRFTNAAEFTAALSDSSPSLPSSRKVSATKTLKKKTTVMLSSKAPRIGASSGLPTWAWLLIGLVVIAVLVGVWILITGLARNA